MLLSYAEHRRDFTYEFSKGERIGICGPNGSGKTTLVRMLTGALPLAAGGREVGETTVVGHFSQHPPPVPEQLRIIDYLRSGQPCRGGTSRELASSGGFNQGPACCLYLFQSYHSKTNQ